MAGVRELKAEFDAWEVEEEEEGTVSVKSVKSVRLCDREEGRDPPGKTPRAIELRLRVR